MMKKKTMS